MNSKDKTSKSAKVHHSNQKHNPKLAVDRRAPNIGSTLKGSSSSSSEDGSRRTRNNSKTKPKLSARANVTSKPPLAQAAETKEIMGDTDLQDMTPSGLGGSDKDKISVATCSNELEQETDVDVSTDEQALLLKKNSTLQHQSSSGSDSTPGAIEDIQSRCSVKKRDPLILYHDEEEINQAPKTSSEEDEFYESGAALTVDDTSESTFVVYPLGCCEFDETQLVSATSTKAIQKCILRLSNKPRKEETSCWGLDQSQPILMRLHEDYIQFTHLRSRTLLRSQPIHAIKTWAVDDDNNFAFVVEDIAANTSTGNNYYESVDYALLSEPSMMCYVFRSIDDDDMSCKVASKLNEEINRHKEQLSYRISKSTRMQQMLDPDPNRPDDPTDVEDFEDLEATNELTMHVRYIGKTPVPRPVGIDVLNIAIDKCLAEASMAQTSKLADQGQDSSLECERLKSGLIDVKLHVSPSSVIVENHHTGEIMVECRIRYLTFMGISRRDIRWCGFIMQNTNNKTFIAHCFECLPTAGHVCEAIQASCTKMYHKVVKNCRQPETDSIIPTRHTIRDTLAKTFSRIKLNAIR